MMALHILVIVGSVRRDRIGIRPARYLQQCCISRGHEATLIDPLEYRLPLLDRMYKEYPAGQAPEVLERLAKLIKSCHAVIVVAGEYNHSIQPALSNLLDHFLEEWFWRPAAIACYSAGQYGGGRAAMQCRRCCRRLAFRVSRRSWRCLGLRICSTSKVNRGRTGWCVKPDAFPTNWVGRPGPRRRPAQAVCLTDRPTTGTDVK